MTSDTNKHPFHVFWNLEKCSLDKTDIIPNVISNIEGYVQEEYEHPIELRDITVYIPQQDSSTRFHSASSHRTTFENIQNVQILSNTSYELVASIINLALANKAKSHKDKAGVIIISDINFMQDPLQMLLDLSHQVFVFAPNGRNNSKIPQNILTNWEFVKGGHWKVLSLDCSTNYPSTMDQYSTPYDDDDEEEDNIDNNKNSTDQKDNIEEKEEIIEVEEEVDDDEEDNEEENNGEEGDDDGEEDEEEGDTKTNESVNNKPTTAATPTNDQNKKKKKKNNLNKKIKKLFGGKKKDNKPNPEKKKKQKEKRKKIIKTVIKVIKTVVKELANIKYSFEYELSSKILGQYFRSRSKEISGRLKEQCPNFFKFAVRLDGNISDMPVIVLKSETKEDLHKCKQIFEEEYYSKCSVLTETLPNNWSPRHVSLLVVKDQSNYMNKPTVVKELETMLNLEIEFVIAKPNTNINPTNKIKCLVNIAGVTESLSQNMIQLMKITHPKVNFLLGEEVYNIVQISGQTISTLIFKHPLMMQDAVSLSCDVALKKNENEEIPSGILLFGFDLIESDQTQKQFFSEMERKILLLANQLAQTKALFLFDITYETDEFKYQWVDGFQDDIINFITTAYPSISFKCENISLENQSIKEDENENNDTNNDKNSISILAKNNNPINVPKKSLKDLSSKILRFQIQSNYHDATVTVKLLQDFYENIQMSEAISQQRIHIDCYFAIYEYSKKFKPKLFSSSESTESSLINNESKDEQKVVERDDNNSWILFLFNPKFGNYQKETSIQIVGRSQDMKKIQNICYVINKMVTDCTSLQMDLKNEDFQYLTNVIRNLNSYQKLQHETSDFGALAREFDIELIPKINKDQDITLSDIGVSVGLLQYQTPPIPSVKQLSFEISTKLYAKQFNLTSLIFKWEEQSIVLNGFTPETLQNASKSLLLITHASKPQVLRFYWSNPQVYHLVKLHLLKEEMQALYLKFTETFNDSAILIFSHGFEKSNPSTRKAAESTFEFGYVHTSVAFADAVTSFLQRSISEIEQKIETITIPITDDHRVYLSAIAGDTENIQNICDEENASYVFEQQNRKTQLKNNTILCATSFDAVLNKTINFSVVDGNILLEQVDCIVNAANHQLNHIGGIAKVIAKAAGRQLENECKAYIQQNQQVPPGSSMTTCAGNLSSNGYIQKVIHTVGPRWSSGNRDECYILHQSIWTLMEQATNNQLTSISIPAISCGNFCHDRVSKKLVISIIIITVLQFLKHHPDSTLNNIHFIDNNKLIVQLFVQILSTLASSKAKDAVPSNSLDMKFKWQWREDQIISGNEAQQGQSLKEASTLNSAKWVDYDAQPSQQLEKAFFDYKMGGPQILHGLKVPNVFNSFAAVEKVPRHMKNRAHQYIAYFDDIMYQQNTHPAYMTKRRIRRVLVADQKFFFQHSVNLIAFSSFVDILDINSIASEEKDVNQTIQPVTNPNQTFLVISGLKNNIVKVENKIRQILDHCVVTEIVEIPSTEFEFNKIFDSVNVRAVEAKINIGIHDANYYLISVHGIKGFHIRDRTLTITTIIAEEIDRLRQEIIAPPIYFAEMSKQTDRIKYVTVDLHSKEAQELIQNSRFKATLPQCTITKIERIQNKMMWERYAFLRAHIKKIRGDPNEGIYWHGTRQTSPSLISEGGFDFRLSQEGYFGRGAYFAKNASYSNSYAYNSTTGKQFFAAFVTLGTAFSSPLNRQLVRPPNGYDSVTGFTNGSDVFIVYDLAQAYPAYLITYH